ncbi:hypothetical protein [Georgenia sp. SUBG003]|uniref:hypothetical protein n=1 Tax=Georgenia sp. SUBG003 TaxID=1497974 RepID=UPI003AB537CD
MASSSAARRYRYLMTLHRLDRLALLNLMRPAFPALDEDYLRSLTRAKMIDALLDAQAEAVNDAWDEVDRYPLRRPDFGTSAPDGRLFLRRSKVHVIWQSDWELGPTRHEAIYRHRTTEDADRP